MYFQCMAGGDGDEEHPEGSGDDEDSAALRPLVHIYFILFFIKFH